MSFKSDIEIANSVTPENIVDVASKIGIKSEDLYRYGSDKAKVHLSALEAPASGQGKVVLVTAITPTPAGEGKTTVSVGLSDALRAIGQRSALALREPSLGPVFGLKGGATGGGRSQVIPMEDINLHFTGDFHAIGAANNLLAAMLDNHIHQGNALNIDGRQVVWKRVVDMNDRQLRHVVNGLQGRINGVPREDGFDITVASEVMAVLCLSSSYDDLKRRLGEMVIAYTYEGEPVTASQIKAEGAMAALLKDALLPNMVQTLEGTPTFIHGGPFANIAHGCSSALATRLAMNYADFTVTEAGFGADLGAEKFMNIKSRSNSDAPIIPSAVVIVATIRALKMHGGLALPDLQTTNVDAVREGLANLEKHVSIVREELGLPAVVAINLFQGDTNDELQVVQDFCASIDVPVSVADVWGQGGQGAKDLAEKVVELAQENPQPTPIYDLEDSLEDKLTAIVQKIYGGEGIELTPAARRNLVQLEADGFASLPICMAKTQNSLSDNAQLKGAPTGFTVTIRQLKVSAGAGFIVAYSGNVMTMPGLPKTPAAEGIGIDSQGQISGLF